MLCKKPIILLAVLFCIGLNSIYAQVSLDRAIRREASFIIKTVPAESITAIVSVNSDNANLSNNIITKLADNVINNKKEITFVSRDRLSEMRQEINFQYSDEVSEEMRVSIGKRLGAQFIVTGAVTEAGTYYNLNIQILDVETAKILGSNTVKVQHDEQMNAFLPNSGVARALRAKEQEEQKKKAETGKKVKDAVGIFSDGTYIGYLGSLNAPIGISFGQIQDDVSLFMDNEFAVPFFEGNERVDKYPSGYTPANKDTSLIWDGIVGVNINIIDNLLWCSLGGGVEYNQDYELVNSDSKKVWVKNGNKNNRWNFAASAGLYVKISYFYIQGKYKYVFGKDLSTSNFGLNHLSLGAGFVWRMK